MKIKSILFLILILGSCTSTKNTLLNGVYDNAGELWGKSILFENGKFKMYEGGCVHSGYGFGKYKIKESKVILNYKVYFSDKGLDKLRKEKIKLRFNDSLNCFIPNDFHLTKDDTLEFNKWYAEEVQHATTGYKHNLRLKNKK